MQKSDCPNMTSLMMGGKI